MKFFIVLSAMVAVALAKPHYHPEPEHHAHTLVYAAPAVHVKYVPAAPLGHDGRVVDTPEVAHAKAEHLAAHEKAKSELAKESHHSYEHEHEHHATVLVPVHHEPAHHAIAYAKIVPAAPLGHDGRVVDTPEVAHAKAAHLAAVEHEKSAIAHEQAKHHDWHHDEHHHEEHHVKLVAIHPAPIHHEAHLVKIVPAHHEW